MDFETRVTQDQDMTEGSAGLWINRKLAKFWLIYNELISRQELHLLILIGKKYGYEVISRGEFIETVFYPEGYTAGAILVFFNAPFDLSRLAIHASYTRGKTYHGGFSLKLSNNPQHPPIMIKNIDSKRSLIGFAAPSFSNKGDKKRDRYRGCFCDLKTSIFSITNESYTLDRALQDYGLGSKSSTAEYSSIITPESIEDNIQHTMGTYQLYEKLQEQFKTFNLDLELHQLVSPATIGKQLLAEMGIKPPSVTDPDIEGAGMSAYFGGRSEVRHRKDPIKVTLMDATSMYSSVFENQGMDEFLKADRIDSVVCPEEIQSLLNYNTLETLVKKETWKSLKGLVWFKPENDILPLRSKYGKKVKHKNMADVPRTIGINYVTSVDGLLCYTIQDALASKLLTGKTPKIEMAVKFVPVGVQEGLQEINLFNHIPIKPNDHILKLLNEERQRVKGQMEEMPDKTSEEYKQLDLVQHGLKTIANSISYGIYLQLTKQPQKTHVDVYGLTHFESDVDKIEKPGPMFNPKIGIFQTAGARLMLAMVEAWLNQHGGYYAGCDTDSMFVSPQHAIALQDFFQPLSPYDDPKIKLFKIEKENGILLDDVWYYGISAKRYALYKISENGEIIILKYSSHGLGQLRLDEKEWWKDIITLHYHPEQKEAILEKYRFRVAAYQLTISTYKIWKMFKQYNKGKPYSQMIKPFNFITVGTHRQRHPKTGDPIIPIVPYVHPDSKNFESIPYMQFYDKKTGELYINPPGDGKLETKSYWNSFADVFEKYINHPEAKSEGDVGRLERRHMVISTKEANHVGKESDEIEVAMALGEDPENTTEYASTTRTQEKLLTTEPRKAVKNGVPRSTYYYARKKVLEGKDYMPQKNTKRRIKGL